MRNGLEISRRLDFSALHKNFGLGICHDAARRRRDHSTGPCR